MPSPRLDSLYELLAAEKAWGSTSEEPAFDPGASALHGRMIFIVGAPRSGTTWLHQMFATHPDVATAGESHLFCEGFGELLDNHADPDPHMKLSTWLPHGELLRLMRELADGVFSAARDRWRPDAGRVLDKTPNHVPHAGRLAAVYPDATFVHLVRDGRDAAASATDLWSWSDAYGRHRAAIAGWRDAITDVRRELSQLRFHEVRYEDLVTDPDRHLAAVFDACELEHDASFRSEVITFARTPINVRPSNTSVGVRKWDDLPAEVEHEMIDEAGDLLVELGYVTEEERDGIGSRPPSTTGRQRSVGSFGARLRGILGRTAAGDAEPGARRREVRAAGEAHATAIVADGVDAVRSTLAREVVLEHGGETVTGADAVATRLAAVLGGAERIALDADERAAAIRYRPEDGPPWLEVCWVTTDGRIDRITLSR